MSSSRWHKNTRMTCACCECAVSSFAHTATDCKPWDLLWRWARVACQGVGRPILCTTTRASWFAFGFGIHGAPGETWTRRHDVAVTIWGAALYAVRVVTADLLRDGIPASPVAAVGIARARVKRPAAQELWWVQHRHEWLRDGGDDARRPPATSAAWAAKWSGLFRLRRDRDCPGRFEERPGGPMSAAWYRDV